MEAPAPVGKIWTVNARESLMLEGVKDYFGLTDRQVHLELTALHADTVKILRDKGIAYSELRTALTPSRDRHEAAFLFDSSSPELEAGYGDAVGDLILAALPKREFSTSILTGDLLIRNQELGFMLLALGLGPTADLAKIRHTSQIYGVYLNNMTESRRDAIDAALRSSSAYLGSVDCTYSSAVKTWLSTTLVHRYLKSGRTFLSGHEPDVPNTENYNLPGWPLEEHGFTSASLQEMYFDLLLSYKIERRTVAHEFDVKHSLTAISEIPHDLSTFDVQLDEAKLAYVAQHGGGGFGAAGLGSLTRREVIEAIRSRIASNYIYDLELKVHEDGATAKFNIMLEFPREAASPVRIQVTVAYMADSRTLRVITMF